MACAKCNREKSDTPPSYAMVQKFIKLYSSTFTHYFNKLQHPSVREFRETQELLDYIASWVGQPNITGLDAFH